MTHRHFFAFGLWGLLLAPIALQPGCTDGNVLGSGTADPDGSLADAGDAGHDADSGEDPPIPCPPKDYEWTFQGTNYACVDVELPTTVPLSVGDIDTTNAGNDYTDKCSPASSTPNDLIYHFRAPQTGTYRISATTTGTAPDSHAVWFIGGDCDDYSRLGRIGLVPFALDMDYIMAGGDHLLIVFEGGKGHSINIRAK